MCLLHIFIFKTHAPRAHGHVHVPFLKCTCSEHVFARAFRKGTCTCPHARGAYVFKIKNVEETHKESGKKRVFNSIGWFNSYWPTKLPFNLVSNLPCKILKCDNLTLKLAQGCGFYFNPKYKSCSKYQNAEQWVK